MKVNIKVIHGSTLLRSNKMPNISRSNKKKSKVAKLFSQRTWKPEGEPPMMECRAIPREVSVR
jgi:hypothetical protein